jgi:hypothetical protein
VAQTEEKRGRVTQIGAHTAQNKNPSINGELSMDQMWEMLQQLIVMLTPNISKAFGIISNDVYSTKLINTLIYTQFQPQAHGLVN